MPFIVPSCASKVHGSGRGWPSAIMHNIGFFHDISRTQSFHDFIFRLCSSLAIGIAQSLGFLFASAYTLMGHPRALKIQRLLEYVGCIIYRQRQNHEWRLMRKSCGNILHSIQHMCSRSLYIK